jgi:hypothetical protein
MLKFSQRSDEIFVRDALDASKRAEVLRRERRNQSIAIVAVLLAIAIWFIAQRHWLAGDGDRSPSADFLFFCLVIMANGGSLHARSNVRLLMGLHALEERLTSLVARSGDS